MFIGIDIGTQGARVVLMDGEGSLVGSREEAFVLSAASREEQLPEVWWEACRRCMSSLLAGVDRSSLRSIAVTSTSGTVIPLDDGHRPLHAALMYSDKRSVLEGEVCTAEAVAWYAQARAGMDRRKGYTAFNSSSGLSKMVWYVRHYPGVAEKIRYWVHAADYITGKLCGRWGITDYTNALKTGFDLHKEKWPAYIYEKLPLRKEWLPEVVASGSPVGVLLPSLAGEWGVSASVQVVAPMTDGCASQLASGAVDMGSWNTTVGTTLVVKGVTGMELADEEGRFYSHRHPDGGWMPGGASNTGADWVREFPVVPEVDLLIPTGLLAYPLRQEGERFPFVASQARGFAPEGVAGPLLFAANMEGVAYVERYAYELAGRLSAEPIKAVYTAGGGSNSHTWLVIRSTVLDLPLYKMRYVTGAAGAAILAASRVYFGSVGEAARVMTRIEKEVAPVRGFRGAYEEGYGKWVEELRGRGFI